MSGNTASSNIYAGVLTYGSAAFVPASPVYNHQNVLVENCTASSNTGSVSVTTQWTGSGIVIGNVNGGTMTGCTATGNGADSSYSGGGPAALWCYNSNNFTIQNSLAYANFAGTSNVDGDGFDLDVNCTNCTVQYCLSYSNAGAGVLLYGGAAATNWSGNTVRYNLCWGNSTATANYYGEIAVQANCASSSIYGNTLVAHDNGAVHPNPVVTGSGTLTGITIRNNIIYGGGTGQLIYALASSTTSNVLYQGNLYYSTGTFAIYWNGTTYASLAAFQAGQSGQEKVSGNPAGLQANPLLIAPGSTPTATAAATMIAGAGGLRLQALSPAAAAGLNLQSLFSVNPGSQDFFGDPLSVPLWIGAYQGVFQYAARGNPGPVIQHFPRNQPPARARTGPRGNVPGAGRPGVLTPLGGPSRPAPFVFRSPLPARARLGNNLQPRCWCRQHQHHPAGHPIIPAAPPGHPASAAPPGDRQGLRQPRHHPPGCAGPTAPVRVPFPAACPCAAG